MAGRGIGSAGAGQAEDKLTAGCDAGWGHARSAESELSVARDSFPVAGRTAGAALGDAAGITAARS